MKEIKFSLDALMKEANNEIALVPYIVKLGLYELGIPVILNPKNLLDDSLNYHHGFGKYYYNQKELVVIWDENESE